MHRTTPPAPAAGLAVGLGAALVVALGPSAAASGASGARAPGGSGEGPRFERVAVFDVAGEVAEIVAATADGRTLVHTDSALEQVGIVDLSDPAAPRAAGSVAVGGEPTSVAVLGGLALVAVAGEEPADGALAVVDLATASVVARVPLGGQPDAVALDPSGARAAVAVENERDEELDEGALPQDPPGFLAVVDLAGAPGTWAARSVDLTGLDGARFPSDPEPEFVDVDDRGIAAVTLQENNAVALVDLARGEVVGSFSAGTTSHPADLTADGDVAFDEELVDARREPDGVAWTPEGNLVTADEGDYDLDLEDGQVVGGRTFTVFSEDGEVLVDSGEDLEVAGALAGHYDDSRSDARGVEVEGVAVATYGGVPHLFVGAERGDYVGVHRFDDEDDPELVQVLATGDAPEGLLALPQRGLFVATGEDDGTISVYELTDGGAGTAGVDVVAPDLERAATALSGLAAAPDGGLYAVGDAAVSPSRIWTLDPTADGAATRAEVTASVRLSREGEPVSYDLEGVAPRTGSDGGWWAVSEGAVDDPETTDEDETTPDLLVAVAADGAVVEEVALPAEVAATSTGRGFEGVAESADGRYVHVAVQDAWEGDVVDGTAYAKIGRYDVARSQWAFARYPLDAPPAEDAAVGLSEIAPAGGSVYALLERDDLADDEAQLKRVYTVDLSGVVFAPAGTPTAELPVLAKTLARDLLAEGPGGGGDEGRYRQEKAEGLARVQDGPGAGTWYLVSDSDGGGETDLRAFGALAGQAAPAPSDAFADLDPRLVGSAVLPGGDVLGTRFGGISGLAFDADRGVHYAIADDRSEFAPARFYTLRVDLADGAFDPGDVDVLAVTTLRGADGQPFATGSVDPEGIALTEDGTLLVTSEGDAAALVPPFVREFALDGAQLAALPVPAAFVPALGADGAPSRGVRPNAAFESATTTPDGERFFTGTEGALVQDGPASTPERGSTTRLLRYDTGTGAPDAQYAYPLGPVAAAPVPADAFATTGLVELLATGDDELLALERSFSTGVGNAVSLYGVSTDGADDVSDLPSLAGQDVEPVTKELLLDLGTLGITLDNLEGVAPGPALPDGRRSLVVVADDNFSDTQVTQVLVLALG